MRIGVLTNEYPPHVYGGAGVHVEYLCKELSRLEDGAHSVEVLPFGEQEVNRSSLAVHGVGGRGTALPQFEQWDKILGPLGKNLLQTAQAQEWDVVHCHTWYTHLAGCLVQQLLGIPLVLTTHSLEPHRPWKAEQLGPGGYRASTWLEKTAYRNADGVVAVSQSMARDVQSLYGVDPERVRVIHNGIDPEEYHPGQPTSVVEELGVDPAVPYVLFVGRITRQKGITHLLRALRHVRSGTQVVLCAASPDTPEIGAETEELVREVRNQGHCRVHWFDAPMPKEQLIALYAHAAVFVCPSIYEPFGIINLEAMSCSTPVVAAQVGGIPEIVVPGQTGYLVPFATEGEQSAEPRDPDRYAKDLAQAVNAILDDPEQGAVFGRQARQRVLKQFSWRSVAAQTLEWYRVL